MAVCNKGVFIFHLDGSIIFSLYIHPRHHQLRMNQWYV